MISPVLENLQHERRRRIVNILRGVRSSIGEEALARRLVEADRGAATNEDVRSARLELAHVHLPSLDDAGLVAWDEEEGIIETGKNPALDAPGIQHVLGRDGDAWDELLACLTNERRRDIVDLLRACDGAMSRRALAREVAMREDGPDPSPEAVEAVLRSLHHVHLPKLQSAGVVECDADDETVVDAEHPGLEAFPFDTNRDETSRTVPRWLACSPG